MMVQIIIASVVILVSGYLFYMFVPIIDSPLSGGPVSASNPPRKPMKVPLKEYYYLKNGILNKTIVE
jgi:hypothetical protein